MKLKAGINSENNFTLREKWLSLTLILFINGTISFVDQDVLLNKLSFLESLYPFFDYRLIGNYKVYFINYVISILVFLFFIFFTLNNLRFLKLNIIQMFFLTFLSIRLFSDFLINYKSILNAEIGVQIQYVTYICFFISLVTYFRKMRSENLKFLNHILNIIIYSSVFHSLLVFYQYFIEFSNYYSGMSFFESFRYIRPISFMGVVTVNSMFIGLGIILLLVKNNQFEGELAFKNKTKFFLLLIIMLLGQFLSGSRGGILAVIVVYIFHLIISKRGMKLKISLTSLYTSMTLIFISVLTIVLLNEYINKYFEKVFISDSASNSTDSRMEKWNIAISLFLKHPFSGVGTNNYGDYQSYLTNGWSNSNPHNVVFQILSENGLIALFVYIITISLTLLIAYIKKANLTYYLFSICFIYWNVSSLYMGTLDNFVLGMLLVLFISVLTSPVEKRKENGFNNIPLSRLEKS